MAIAKLVSRNVKPVHTHDCKECTFLDLKRRTNPGRFSPNLYRKEV